MKPLLAVVGRSKYDNVVRARRRLPDQPHPACGDRCRHSEDVRRRRDRRAPAAFPPSDALIASRVAATLGRLAPGAWTSAEPRTACSARSRPPSVYPTGPRAAPGARAGLSVQEIRRTPHLLRRRVPKAPESFSNERSAIDERERAPAFGQRAFASARPELGLAGVSAAPAVPGGASAPARRGGGRRVQAPG